MNSPTYRNLIEGTLDDLKPGHHIVFEEIENDKLVSCTGLESLIKMSYNNKTVYITDNHNHALYFWYDALKNGVLYNRGANSWYTLLHVDQHADMNEPDERIDPEKQWDLDYIAEYVNTHTQIASFIQPALRSGLIGECVQIRTESKLQEIADNIWAMNHELSADYILDIDIDFFAHESNIEPKIALLQRLISSAALVTIATSPYFIDQNRAIEIIKKLLS